MSSDRNIANRYLCRRRNLQHSAGTRAARRLQVVKQKTTTTSRRFLSSWSRCSQSAVCSQTVKTSSQHDAPKSALVVVGGLRVAQVRAATCRTAFFWGDDDSTLMRRSTAAGRPAAGARSFACRARVAFGGGERRFCDARAWRRSTTLTDARQPATTHDDAQPTVCALPQVSVRFGAAGGRAALASLDAFLCATAAFDGDGRRRHARRFDVNTVFGLVRIVSHFDRRHVTTFHRHRASRTSTPPRRRRRAVDQVIFRCSWGATLIQTADWLRLAAAATTRAARMQTPSTIAVAAFDDQTSYRVGGGPAASTSVASCLPTSLFVVLCLLTPSKSSRSSRRSTRRRRNDAPSTVEIIMTRANLRLAVAA